MFFTLTVCVVSAQSENSLSNASDSITFQTPFEDERSQKEIAVSPTNNNESLIVLKSREWGRAVVLEVNKNHVLVQKGEVLVRLNRYDIYRIYPSGQGLENALNFLEKNETYKLVELTNSVNVELGKPEKEKKVYNVTHVNLLSRRNKQLPNDEGNFNLFNGIGIENVTGYRFGQYLGLGLGLGVYNYLPDHLSGFRPSFEFESGPEYSPLTIPVFLDIRGSLSKKKFSPYYSVAIGLTNNILATGAKQDFENTLDFWNGIDPSLDLKSNDFKVNPGLYFQPTIGMSIKAKKLDFLIDFGLQIANLNYVDTDFFCIVFDSDCSSFSPVYKVQEKVRRVVLRFGIML